MEVFFLDNYCWNIAEIDSSLLMRRIASANIGARVNVRNLLNSINALVAGIESETTKQSKAESAIF